MEASHIPLNYNSCCEENLLSASVISKFLSAHIRKHTLAHVAHKSARSVNKQSKSANAESIEEMAIITALDVLDKLTNAGDEALIIDIKRFACDDRGPAPLSNYNTADNAYVCYLKKISKRTHPQLKCLVFYQKAGQLNELTYKDLIAELAYEFKIRHPGLMVSMVGIT